MKGESRLARAANRRVEFLFAPESTLRNASAEQKERP